MFNVGDKKTVIVKLRERDEGFFMTVMVHWSLPHGRDVLRFG